MVTVHKGNLLAPAMKIAAKHASVRHVALRIQGTTNHFSADIRQIICKPDMCVKYSTCINNKEAIEMHT